LLGFWSQEAEEKFKRLTHVYAVLSDPERRKDYDRHGEEASDVCSFFLIHDICLNCSLTKSVGTIEADLSPLFDNKG
jgi:DnaJ-class molecular chaperone